MRTSSSSVRVAVSATNLTPHQGDRNFAATDISPDGKTVLITSNAGNGYQNAGLLDVATKKITWLTNDKWEVNSGELFHATANA